MRRLRNFFRLLALGVVISLAGCGGGGGSSSGGGTTPPPVTTFTIAASAGTGGSIDPAGTTTLTSGSSQIYTITPANGFTIQDVMVDGVSVGAVPTYTFSNVTAYHTITASFTLSTYTISLTASKNIALNNNSDLVNLTATISPAVPDGTAVTFTAPSGTTISNVTPASGNVATAVARSTAHASVSITASFAGANGSTIVKFIPQPASADVFIALDSAIAKLDSLNLKFVNDAGATYTSATSLNQLLADAGSLLTAGPGVSDPANTISIGIISAAGFTTVANTPIIQLTYNGITSGIPGFRVGSVVSASTYPSVPLTLSLSNFVVTVTYKDSGGNSL